MTIINNYLNIIQENKKILNELFIELKSILHLNTPEKEKQLLRLAIIAETDAVNLYEAMAQNTNNRLLKKLFLDVAREEKVHFGEFEEALEMIDKEHEPAEEEGEDELKDMGFSDLD